MAESKAEAPKTEVVPSTEAVGEHEKATPTDEWYGKVVGPEHDSSFHVYEFNDPETGEKMETHRVIHDVAVGVNEDGSVKTEKADKVHFNQGKSEEAHAKAPGQQKKE